MLPALVYGDAIGNHVMEMWKLLRSWGYRSDIYADYCHPKYAYACKDYRQYKGSSENILIFHYSIGSEVTDFVRQLPDRIVLYYHNITPSHFFRGINRELERQLEEGRQRLASFKDVPFAIAASEYNRQELLALGFKEVAVVPYILDFAKLDASAESKAGMAIRRRYDDGAVNILFVGRIVPNKCQEDLIKIFSYYHKLMNHHSRLLLVGSSANAEAYRFRLEFLARALDLEDSVHFCGHVGLDEGLGAYYKVANVFLCMSEHEGFCVPLLESAHFCVPIIAYKAAGVPYTLGNAGILIKEKRYDAVAEVIALLASDEALRRRVVAKQQERLRAFERGKLASRLHGLIRSFIGIPVE